MKVCSAARCPASRLRNSESLRCSLLSVKEHDVVNLHTFRTRRFTLGEQRSLQARFDVQNVLNYAAFGNPNTDPTNTNFGKVTTAVGAAGAMRFFSFGMRFGF